MKTYSTDPGRKYKMATNTARMCSKHNVDCPARCNTWYVPCDDEPDFIASINSDLSPASGIIRSVFVSAFVWIIFIVVIWAAVRAIP